jgi:Lrp/AsnC family transcriptional regulator, leucine-responsive regulatory protein
MTYKIEKSIIEALDENPLVHQSRISKILKIPQQTINYRINKLLSEKVISQFATIIDYMLLGYKQIHIFFKTVSVLDREDEIIEYFKNHPKIWWAAKVGSSYDILVELVIKEFSEIEDFIEELNNRFAGVFQDTIVLLVTKHEIYNHPFLAENKKNLKKRFCIELCSDKPTEVDSLDVEILSLIKNNCRYPMAKLSTELSHSSATIKDRIKKLERTGIIKGYRLFHGIKKKSAFIGLMTYREFSREKEKKLISDIYMMNEFTHYWKTIGRYNMIVHARCEDYEEFYNLVRKLRKRNKIIKDYILVPVFKDIRVDTFPCTVNSGSKS